MHSFPDMFLYIFTIIISGVIIKINSFYYFSQNNNEERFKHKRCISTSKQQQPCQAARLLSFQLLSFRPIGIHQNHTYNGINFLNNCTASYTFCTPYSEASKVRLPFSDSPTEYLLCATLALIFSSSIRLGVNPGS